jgi:hypothetical protein
MFKKSSLDSNNNRRHDGDKKKKQKIIWDEVTIAEHDKERGSRL